MTKAQIEAWRDWLNTGKNAEIWAGSSDQLCDMALKGLAVTKVVARPLSEWHDDNGDVLLWRFPISEPPRVGSPLNADWPMYEGYYTHWTPLPEAPRSPPREKL